MNRDMLSRRLVERGYEVVVAVDGEAGVSVTWSERPALVLMGGAARGEEPRCTIIPNPRRPPAQTRTEANQLYCGERYEDACRSKGGIGQ